MSMTFEELCEKLEAKIVNSYEEGVSLVDAEMLAAEFLHAQMQVSKELKEKDLSSRMRKSGLKAVRAAVYLEIVQKNEKKPTEAQIGAMIDTHELVSGEQQGLDTSEVDRDDLERYYDIFGNAHVYFRGIAKGNRQFE